jgi:hypothetical protein
VVNGPAGLFAVQDFSRAFTKMSPEQQENQVGSLLTAKGLHVTGATAEARRSCDGNIGLLGVNSVVVIRFESGDLTTLDPEVAKKIAAEPNRNVAVGACRTRDAAGFSRYKIALLFY